MKLKKTLVNLAVALFFIAAFAAPDAGALAKIVMGQTDRVQFASGGIGVGEREVMMDMAKDFNLKLVFANSEGHYLAGTSVMIRKPGGEALLTTTATGPWMLVHLPAGSYEVVSTCRMESKTRHVRIGQGLQSVVFTWKAEDKY